MAFNVGDLRPLNLIAPYQPIIAITRAFCADSVVIILETATVQIVTMIPYN